MSPLTALWLLLFAIAVLQVLAWHAMHRLESDINAVTTPLPMLRPRPAPVAPMEWRLPDAHLVQQIRKELPRIRAGERPHCLPEPAPARRFSDDGDPA